ncbi:MAG: hypothetical protein D6800_02140, partial [Candidatus Zixiibacteriota bacterium]
VAPEIIKERNLRLTEVSHRIRKQALQRQVGQTLPVIAEKKHEPDGSGWGIADNYIRVRLGPDCPGGRAIHRMRITSAHDDYVAGEYLPAPA